MGFLASIKARLRRLFGASGASTAASLPTPRLADLLTESMPFSIASATVDDHVAVVMLREPLPAPLQEPAEQRLLEATWRFLREHPAEGPVRVLEVWAPPVAGAPPSRALRREFAAPVVVSPGPWAEDLRAHHQRLPMPQPAPGRTMRPTGPPEHVDESLRPLGKFLIIPSALAERLAARGVDVAGPNLVSLVVALLEEAGYAVGRPADERGSATDLAVTAAGTRALVRCYRSDGHVAAKAVDQFGFAFLRSGASEGFFMTDGLLGFETRHWERDSRIHLLDRVGIQRLVDAVALRPAGSANQTPRASGAG